MRKLLIILALCGSAFAGTCGNGYTYSLKFVARAAKVPNTDQANFPVALAFNGAHFYNSFYLPDLATVANGGQIQNTANNSITVSGPADLIFCDAASAGNALKFEVATYTATTGAMEAYVQIPTLSHTTDNSFWMFYGNAAVVTTQQDLSFWAAANYKSVYHLIDGSSLGAKDSTGTFNGTITTATAVTGAIDGGMNVNGGSIDTGNAQNASGSVTYETWLFPTSIPAQCYGLIDNNYAASDGISLDFNPTCAANGRFYTAVRNGGTYQFLNTDSTATANLWTHVLMTMTGSGTANNHMYVNGVESTYNGASGSKSIGTATTNLKIATDVVAGNHFPGYLDEVRVSSVVRSADWAATNFNTMNSPSDFSIMFGPATGPRIVQYIDCSAAATVSSTCTFRANVTSGNLVVVVASNMPSTNCSGPSINSLFSDSLSSTFTFAAGSSNTLGSQALVCIAYALPGSTGSETVTTAANPVAAHSVVAYEIAGLFSISFDASNGATGGGVSSLSTGSATASTSNSLVICGLSNSTSGLTAFTSSTSPTAAFINTTPNISTGGTSLVQFTSSGSKSCTFTFNNPSSSPTRSAAAIAIIKYNLSATSKRRVAQVY